MLGDRLAELLALLRVGGGVLQRGAGQAGGGGAEGHPRAVEGGHQPTESLALVAEPAVLGHGHVLQEQLGVDDRPLPHLPHRLPAHETLVAALEHEGGDAAVAAARLDRGEHHVVVRHPAVGDPALLAADDVAPVGPAGGRLDRGGVRARRRLGGGQRREGRALAAQRLQPAPLLGVGAERQQRLREEAVGGDQVADAGAAVGELLLDDAAGQAVGHARAPQLLGQHERRQADRGRLLPHVPRELGVGLVHGQRDGADLTGGEVPAHPLDLPLLGRDLEWRPRSGHQSGKLSGCSTARRWSSSSMLWPVTISTTGSPRSSSWSSAA